MKEAGRGIQAISPHVREGENVSWDQGRHEAGFRQHIRRQAKTAQDICRNERACPITEQHRRHSTVPKAQASEVAALMESAIHHHCLSAPVCLLGDDCGQVPASLGHQVSAQLDHQPGRSRALNQ